MKKRMVQIVVLYSSLSLPFWTGCIGSVVAPPYIRRVETSETEVITTPKYVEIYRAEARKQLSEERYGTAWDYARRINDVNLLEEITQECAKQGTDVCDIDMLSRMINEIEELKKKNQAAATKK